MVRVGDHAVVLGASMGGLLAARTLSEFYHRVTVVERDELIDGPDARRGVPQGRQPHVLLARCGVISEELFPGLADEMVADGAHRWSDGDLSRFHVTFAGHLITRTGRLPEPASLINHYAGRPFIEWHVRRRLRALPNVTILDGHDFVDYTSAERAVTGVRVCRRRDGSTSDLRARLVVDATGRGSRTPFFLEGLGYGRPPERELAVHVTYASMPVRIPDGSLPELMIARLFEPGRPTGFVMFQCERDTWIVGAGTLGDVRAPTTPAEVLAFGAGLVPDHALAAARAGEPLAGVSLHRFPANRWRRYDKMRSTPAGLVVLGDAVCSFNPIYGQGMTVASIEAILLRDCLTRGDRDLPRRFHRAAAKPIGVAWQTAVGSDLALPEVSGNRPISTRVTNAYIDRVLTAAESDPVVAQEFLRVVGMLQPPSRLVAPSFVRRVARSNRRRTHDRVAAVTQPSREAV